MDAVEGTYHPRGRLHGDSAWRCYRWRRYVKHQSSLLTGYFLVLVSAVASGAGGAFSEKLLKGKGFNQGNTGQETIHWQNVQLYVFGLMFGLISLHLDVKGTQTWPKCLLRIQHVCICDCYYTSYMWTFGIFYTQILGQCCEVFLCCIEHAVCRALGFCDET